MPDILVDPVLLTFSTAFTTNEQKAQYLQLLNRWAEAASETRGAYTWHCSDKLVYLLQSNGLFPDFKTLLQLQKAYNAIYSADPPIDIRRIQNWLQHIVDSQCEHEFNFNNPAVEALAHATLTDASLIDVESQKTTFQPPAFASRWHPQIKQQATDLFTRLCVCAHLGYSYAPGLHIATKGFQPDLQLQGTTSVRVDTTLYYLPVAQPTQSASSPSASTDADEEVFQSVQVFHTFPLLFSINPPGQQKWRWNGTEADLRAAIEREYNARYRKMIEDRQREDQLTQGQIGAANLPNLPLLLTFGSHFLKELEEAAHAAHENLPKRLVDAAAAILADQAFYIKRFNLKHFRESEGGDTAFRRRGNDIAFRIYVTPSRGGWRLNYWKGPTAEGRERVEFSAIQREGEKPKIYND